MNEHCAREVWHELSTNGFSDVSFDKDKKQQKTYKIRNKKTGQFSTGGNAGGWSKKGKAWTGISHLKCHLIQNQRKYHDIAEVVVMTENTRFDIEDIDKYSE